MTRHHHHRHHLQGFGYFRRLGPGIVTGAADDDPSGIGTYSQIGSQFRYGFLWTGIVCLPLAAAVQETAARLGLASGKGLAALIKERFPRWVLFGSVALVVGANVFNIGADLGAMAAAVRLVVPVPFTPLVLTMGLVMLGLEIALPYHRYARVLRWLVLSLGAYVVVLGVVRVDWGEVARSAFVPSPSLARAHAGALLAIFGTTISPYLFFWQAGEELEEKHEHPRENPVEASHVRAMRLDVIAGMGSAVVVMLAIMIATGATLGGSGASIETADQAAAALRPIAGSFAGLLFAVGIVGTGALAVPVLAGSTGYALAESFGWREGLWRRFRRAPGFYGAIAGAILVGIGLNFFGVNPIRGLFLAALFNGLAAPPLILLMLILSNSRAAVGSERGGRVSDLLVGIAFILMAGLAVIYLVS